MFFLDDRETRVESALRIALLGDDAASDEGKVSGGLSLHVVHVLRGGPSHWVSRARKSLFASKNVMPKFHSCRQGFSAEGHDANFGSCKFETAPGTYLKRSY